MTPAKKAAITVKADAYSLSASTYLRELSLPFVESLACVMPRKPA